MEKCKFCDAELEEGISLCPACGKDNAEPAEESVDTPKEETADAPEEETVDTPAQESTPQEAKAGHKASPAILAAGVIMAVALVAVLVALLIGGMKEPAADATVSDGSGAAVDSSVSGDVTTETVASTVPEGSGDPTSVGYKGTYTVSDDEVIANKDVVVATAGEHELTLGELQIYYWQEVSGFLSQYGYYASYYGLDVSVPLDQQLCPVMEGLTWQQYFLYSALNSWHSYLALDAEAEEVGFELPQDYQEHVSTIPEQLEEQALNSGYESAQAMMTYNVGAGPVVEDYAKFMEIYYHGYTYFNDFYSNATASEEEVEAMFAAHEAEYAEMGLTKDTKTVNVRHILIYPDGATSDTVRTEVFSEEAWAAGKAAAEDILNQWLAGDATEESFAALAEQYSGDGGSSANGGLYTDVYEGQMVTNFNDWCFDPARQVGDYEIVETEFGYHIMFYSGETYQWYSNVEADVISEKTNNMVDAALAKYPLTVYYDRILLSMAEAFRVS